MRRKKHRKGFSQSEDGRSNMQSIPLKMLQTFNGNLARSQSYGDLKFAIFCTLLEAVAGWIYFYTKNSLQGTCNNNNICHKMLI
jgi:hypothetical protein